MQVSRSFVSLLFIAVLCISTAKAGLDPIWLSPTNVDLSTPEGSLDNLAESYIAEKGVWANLTVGAGSRATAPFIAMDSTGILWILFGQRHYTTNVFSNLELFNVWNYDPKTDLYRYVWGNSDTAASDPRNSGGLRVETETNHPGYQHWGSGTIDNNDNIWIYSYEGSGELWMFNTTSMLFVRQFGLSGDNDSPSVGANSGQPAEDVWPGYTDGSCMVTDSQNNIWMLVGSNFNGYVNAVWHFNTTSLLWTYIYGDIEPGTPTDSYYAGSWLPGCFMDENDIVWLYGGSGNDEPRLWSYDTRGTPEYKLEYSPAVFNQDSLYPVFVSTDYNADNHPGSCEGCMLVDRMDGTLMLLASGAYTDVNDQSWGATHVWQYSKSLKQWKFLYGNTTAYRVEGVYSNYREPGSTMPNVIYNARTNGKNMKGDIYVVGGSPYEIIGELPGRKDIWLIPNDQCSSPTANKCDPNADCIEEMIGYSCSCKQGYTGDGFTCVGPPVAVPVAEGVPVAPVAAPAKPTNTPSSKTNSASVVGASIVVVGLAVVAIN